MNAQQGFKEEPIYTEVNPGANAELRCVIENIGGECRWQKDGKVSTCINIAFFTALVVIVAEAKAKGYKEKKTTTKSRW